MSAVRRFSSKTQDFPFVPTLPIGNRSEVGNAGNRGRHRVLGLVRQIQILTIILQFQFADSVRLRHNTRGT